MSDDWRPTATWRALHQRADLKRFVRQFFDERGYVEVDTPLLSADTVVDAHIEPIAVRTGGRDMWLQTSPEFAMKRLLAADCGPMYQLGPAFREGEAGRRHNPEFTLLEWYRPDDTIEDQIAFVTSLLTAVADAFPSPRLWRMLVTDNEEGLSPERVSYDDTFSRSTGLSGLGANASQLAAALEERGITPPPGLPVEDAYLDEWRNVTLAELIEPTLGVGRPTFLTDYPASQAALARLKPDDPRVAERFELYIDGVEYANGYAELTDPAELRERVAAQNAIRRRDGRPELPTESRLLAAMEAGLPPCAGVALGFDRLCTLVFGGGSIHDHFAFPFDRA